MVKPGIQVEPPLGLMLDGKGGFQPNRRRMEACLGRQVDVPLPCEVGQMVSLLGWQIAVEGRCLRPSRRRRERNLRPRKGGFGRRSEPTHCIRTSWLHDD